MGRVINLLNSPIIGKKSSFSFVSLLTGLGITYEVYKPCDELKDAIAKAKSSPGQKLNGVDVQSEVSSELGATA